MLDIGTSNIRASSVDSHGQIISEFRTKFTPISPTRGFVEFDAEKLFQNSIYLLDKILSEQNCSALAITNQRASTVVFDPATLVPVCMGQSWQDLRTAPMCLALKSSGITLSPNQSAPKISLAMDLFDKDRQLGLAGGTIDAWMCYRLTGTFATDHTNVAMTGLVEPNATKIDRNVLSKLHIPEESIPQIRPSIGEFGLARIGGFGIPLMAMMGDQQASMLGQGITVPGRAKATFGTGAMVDLVTGEKGPSTTGKLRNGTIPIVARSDRTGLLFGLEAIGLHAGSAVEFACHSLGLAPDPASLGKYAANSTIDSSAIFVPALTGLATPYWDFGALACFAGLTHATSRSDLAMAVIIGIAHMGADLIEAIEADSGARLDSISVDGGMTHSKLFLQQLSNLNQKRLAVSSANEATTLGAGFAALLALGVLDDVESIDEYIKPNFLIEPDPAFDNVLLRKSREHWRRAVEMSLNSIPELSSVTF